MGNAYSEHAPVTSGIPQGSILGPLLFIIFINDLPESLTNLCKIFADDTKLYGSSKRRASIQEDLLKLMEWSEIWQLNFNIDKCCALHFGNKNPNNKYYMDKNSQKELTKIENEKDVGVTFDHNLFLIHI